MRSALSILGLVIALAVVMFVAKKQMQAVKPPVAASAASSAASASDGGLPRPDAVGQQVQDLLKQGERRASDAE